MRKNVLFCTLVLALGLCACNNIPDDPTTLPTTMPTVETTMATEPSTVPTTEQTEPAQSETTPTTGGDAVFTFPEGTSVLGTDLTGLTLEEGYAALCERLAGYELRLTVNGTDISISGEDLELTYPQDAFLAAAEAMAAGQGGSFAEPLSYSESALRRALSAKLDRSVSNAYLRYNSSAGVFDIRSERNGRTTDLSDVMKEADRQILALGPGFSAEAPVTATPAAITADSDIARAAREKANAMLELDLSYTYTPTGGSTSTEVLSRGTIASFLSFDSSLNVRIDTGAISEYAWKMNEKYQSGGGKGPFRTTYGSTVDLTVEYKGQGVNTGALEADIRCCLENHISGTREAPYLDADVCANMPYNGTYIEVNLSAQHVWFYKNGNLVVESPIVSGCVSKNWTTPNGVFSIYQKFTNSYISGGTAYVHCFMAYNGNYGLHDATWRDSFGGDIYLTDGSHGCSNMPKDAALTVYRNAPLGTMVILYGGETSLEQKINGADAYRMPADSAPFVLDAAAAYGTQALSFASSDPAVVEVAQDGTVTIRGQGKAEIMVTCPKFDKVPACEKVIQVEIYSPCLDGRHSYGTWEQTKAPSCVPGEETAVCACGDVQTRPVAAVAEHIPGSWTVTTEPSCGVAGEESTACGTCGSGMTRPADALEHDFASGGEFCDRGCGAANPQYQRPEETQPEETEPEETQPEETEPEGTEPEQDPGENPDPGTPAAV